MSQMTKKELSMSLKKLMEKTSLEKITVKDVVTDCGVNRQTFYYHFQDIYDLLGWIYKTEALKAIDNCKTYETWQQGFLKIFQYVSENKTFCMNTYHSVGRDHLEEFLLSVTVGLLTDVVDELAAGINISPQDKKFIANFYSFAFIGLMLSWLKTGAKDAPDQIIKNLNKLIEGDIGRAIEKFAQR